MRSKSWLYRKGRLLLRLDQLQQALVIQQELEQVQLKFKPHRTQEAEVKADVNEFASGIAKNIETKQKAILETNRA